MFTIPMKWLHNGGKLKNGKERCKIFLYSKLDSTREKEIRGDTDSGLIPEEREDNDGDGPGFPSVNDLYAFICLQCTVTIGVRSLCII